MKKIVSLVAALVLLVSAVTSAQNEALAQNKAEDIKRLLDMTGALQIGQLMSSAVVQQMTEIIKRTRPDIPEEMFDILREEVNQVIAEEMEAEDGLADLIIAIYSRHFSHPEIKGLISFYQTDLGRKIIEVMPTLVQESMLVGQKWGESLGPKIETRITQRFKEKGINLEI